MNWNKLFVVILILSAAGCTNHNEDDYFMDNPEICYTDERSYSEHIAPILEASCVACHNAGSAAAGIILDNDHDTKQAIETGNLMQSIRHEEGVKPMPLNGNKLSDCEIDQIQAWIDQGMPSN